MPKPKNKATVEKDAPAAATPTAEIAPAAAAPAAIEVIKPRDPAEVARTWAEQEQKIVNLSKDIGVNILTMGALLNTAQAEGSWAHVKDDKDNFRFPKFSDVIETLTPWRKAYGYQAMALARQSYFTPEIVKSLGVKKSLRLAAALEVTKGTEREAQIRDLTIKAADLTADATDDEIDRIMGKADASGGASGGGGNGTPPAEPLRDLRGGEWGCKLARGEGESGTFMVGLMSPDDRTAIRAEIRKEGGEFYLKLSVLNVVPEAK